MNAYTVKDIADYIIRTYPESILCQDGSDNPSVSDCVDFFQYDKLGWCGCGRPELALDAVRKYLDAVRARHEESVEAGTEMLENAFGHKYADSDGLLLCLAYTLDEAELTEHGSGVGRAWLTDEGAMFLTLLNMEDDE